MNRILRLTRPDVFSSGESLLNSRVHRLTRAIHDPRTLSEDYVRCIRGRRRGRARPGVPRRLRRVAEDDPTTLRPIAEEAIETIRTPTAAAIAC